MKKVSIPEPCHEDWDKMTPTEIGALCDKCQIDVIDFTIKTPDEVRNILKESAGKNFCGHISKAQLKQLNLEYYAWENQTSHVFQSKFLLACVVVFGMTLFTACETDPQIAYEDIEQGRMAVLSGTIHEEDIIEPDTLKNCNPPVEEDETIEEDCKIVGEFQAVEPDSTNEPPKHTRMLNGGMVIAPDYLKYLDDTIGE
ncbi:hypothetical protein JYT72_00315 [Crocinitomix catalasitica]|nr:hypothetical protein [Crocinitomix catalasitica]